MKERKTSILGLGWADASWGTLTLSSRIEFGLAGLLIVT